MPTFSCTVRYLLKPVWAPEIYFYTIEYENTGLSDTLFPAIGIMIIGPVTEKNYQTIRYGILKKLSVAQL
jgi:hypothetical protein